MMTVTQGLKECLQQITKLESWMDAVNVPKYPPLRKALKEFRENIEQIIQETS